MKRVKSVNRYFLLLTWLTWRCFRRVLQSTIRTDRLLYFYEDRGLGYRRLKIGCRTNISGGKVCRDLESMRRRSVCFCTPQSFWRSFEHNRTQPAFYLIPHRSLGRRLKCENPALTFHKSWRSRCEISLSTFLSLAGALHGTMHQFLSEKRQF